MTEKETYTCEWCRKPFTARKADRKRGWARFCSKSCKASKQEKRTGQNAVYHNQRDTVDDYDGSWDAHNY